MPKPLRSGCRRRLCGILYHHTIAVLPGRPLRSLRASTSLSRTVPCLVPLLQEETVKNRKILLILALAIPLLGIPISSVAAPAAGSYVVRQGDTLYSIARSLGVQLQALRDSNGIADASRILAGQVLTVPGSAEVAQTPAQASPAAAGSYVVKQGDTLYSIARSVGVQVQALQGANGITEPSKIRVGQVLTVPGAAQAGAPPVAVGNAYRAASPEYGMHLFVMGAPATTARDLQKLKDAGFTWQKSLFQWRLIEGAGKGQYDWAESDRVVAASNNAGVKIIARIDFEPMWARSDRAHNGPPDNPSDYGDFVYALVSRYKTGSPQGRVHAIEIWNEPNLAREWGNKPPNPREYVALLKAGYEAAKRADPNVTVLSARPYPYRDPERRSLARRCLPPADVRCGRQGLLRRPECPRSGIQGPSLHEPRAGGLRPGLRRPSLLHLP